PNTPLFPYTTLFRSPLNGWHATMQEAIDSAISYLDFYLNDEIKPKPFKSSHFDDENILAHVRMNDRTTTDGKKVLFVEEVQSDRSEEHTSELQSREN